MSKGSEFEVKPGAVVPPPKLGGGPGPRRRYPLHTMEIDAVIFVPGKKPSTFTTYVHKQARVLGRRFRTQGAIMRKDPKTGAWEPCEAGADGAEAGVAVTRVS